MTFYFKLNRFRYTTRTGRKLYTWSYFEIRGVDSLQEAFDRAKSQSSPGPIDEGPFAISEQEFTKAISEGYLS